MFNIKLLFYLHKFKTMKKLFTIALITIGAVYAKAQVVLEHSYNENWPMEVVNIEGDGYKYLGIDTTTKAIKIYNTDHSLWKTINTSIPQGATIYSVSSYASKYLFNADMLYKSPECIHPYFLF